MARWAVEIAPERLTCHVAPWWQYVPYKLNVAETGSPLDKIVEAQFLQEKYKWKPVDPRPITAGWRRYLRAVQRLPGVPYIRSYTVGTGGR